MINFYLSGNSVHDAVITAFYDGCPEPKRLVKNFQYQPSDVAVIFGFFKKKIAISIPRGMVFSQQRSRNLDVIVLETGYIKRGDGSENYFAAGFNGLNGRADFKNVGMPSDRFLQLDINLKPWRATGDYILLAGQVPWDASVDHIDMEEWLREKIQQIRANTDLPIVFRPHPLGNIRPLPDCEYSTRPLSADLANARAVVCFNSNIGVDATIEGIPVFVGDVGSMVYGIANDDISLLGAPLLKDRQQWANDIAYTQWLPSEMSTGLAWKHLFR